MTVLSHWALVKSCWIPGVRDRLSPVRSPLGASGLLPSSPHTRRQGARFEEVPGADSQAGGGSVAAGLARGSEPRARGGGGKPKGPSPRAFLPQLRPQPRPPLGAARDLPQRNARFL